jgi:hypothetical protein
MGPMYGSYTVDDSSEARRQVSITSRWCLRPRRKYTVFRLEPSRGFRLQTPQDLLLACAAERILPLLGWTMTPCQELEEPTILENESLRRWDGDVRKLLLCNVFMLRFVEKPLTHKLSAKGCNSRCLTSMCWSECDFVGGVEKKI